MTDQANKDGGWMPIETAPKDGTVVRVKNSVMERSVQAKWGPYKSRLLPHLPVTDEWVLVKDDLERFMPMAHGSLIIPDIWAPLGTPEPARARTQREE